MRILRALAALASIFRSAFDFDSPTTNVVVKAARTPEPTAHLPRIVPPHPSFRPKNQRKSRKAKRRSFANGNRKAFA